MRVNSTTQKTQNPNFGMALIIKGRAINNTKIFPNAHSNFIRSAVAKANNPLEKLAKYIDITIDVEPPARGLDFAGVENFLVVSANRVDKENTIFSAIKRLFTEPVSNVSIPTKVFKDLPDQDKVLVKMATEAKNRL